MQEALDFREECDSIVTILDGQEASIFNVPTLFKTWTIKDIIAHLHLWNLAADQTLHHPEMFAKLLQKALPAIAGGISHPKFQRQYFGNLTGQAMYEAWRDYYPNMAIRYAKADPNTRVKWVGPDMSVSSCIIARQMEHWAHAQAIFDVLGHVRQNTDRLKNVAHIGVTTYSWSFKVNGREPILPKPYVRLCAPSGAIWEWNEPQTDNRVEGSAVQFCQVVTQCRNIGDTDLQTYGEAAQVWMQIAQAFAGGAERTPTKGSRYRQDYDW